MFAARAAPAAKAFTRAFTNGAKVSVLGAAGGIGQPVSLLMAMNPLVSRLSLYDIVRTPGVAVDLSHGSDVVIIPAGVPRKPGMTRDDLFNTNAGIAMNLAKACATACPKACILVICNPVNSTVPIFSETFKKMGVHDPRKIMGVTELDSVRARKFISEALGMCPKECNIPVIGGHAGTTIIPLLSQLPDNKISKLDVPAITKRIQFGGDEVVAAKEGAGSATLSMAYAGATFAGSILRGLNGETGIIEPAYIEQDVLGCKFFASQCELGRQGVERAIPIPKNITATEQANINEAIPALQKQIAKGIAFTDKNYK